MFILNYRGMVEKKMQISFSFWDLYLFELIFLFIYWWIPKTKAHFGFCHQRFLKLLRNRRKRSKKVWFCEKCFHFQIFLIFGNSEIDFGINLKHFFNMNYQYFCSHGTFLLKCWHTVKQIWTIPLQCRQIKNFLWQVPWLHKTFCPKREGNMETWYYLENAFN